MLDNGYRNWYRFYQCLAPDYIDSFDASAPYAYVSIYTVNSKKCAVFLLHLPLWITITLRRTILVCTNRKQKRENKDMGAKNKLRTEEKREKREKILLKKKKGNKYMIK